MGERILRELQLPFPRRAAERRGLLHTARGPDPDREMATPLQHHQTAQLPGIPTTSHKGLHPDGPEADHALTFNLDHSVGAVQRIRENNMRLLRPKKPTRSACPIMYSLWEKGKVSKVFTTERASEPNRTETAAKGRPHGPPRHRTHFNI
jgi:hypothetical protein